MHGLLLQPILWKCLLWWVLFLVSPDILKTKRWSRKQSCYSFLAWNWFLTLKAASKFFFNLVVSVTMLSWPLSSFDPQNGPMAVSGDEETEALSPQVPYTMTVASLGLEPRILAPLQTSLWAGWEALSRKQGHIPSSFSPSNISTALINKNETVSPSLTSGVENLWYSDYIHYFTFTVV